MLQFSGWSCPWPNFSLVFLLHGSYMRVFTVFFFTWFQLAYLTNYSQVSFQGSESKHILLCGNNLWEWLTVDLENAAYLWKNSAYAMPTETRLIQERPFPENSPSYPSEALSVALQTRWLGKRGVGFFWPLGFSPATNRLQVFMFLLLRRRIGEITASVHKQDTRK